MSKASAPNLKTFSAVLEKDTFAVFEHNSRRTYIQVLFQPEKDKTEIYVWTGEPPAPDLEDWLPIVVPNTIIELPDGIAGPIYVACRKGDVRVSLLSPLAEAPLVFALP